MSKLDIENPEVQSRLLEKFDKNLLDLYKLELEERTPERDHYVRDIDGYTTVHFFIFEDGSFKIEIFENYIDCDGGYCIHFIPIYPEEKQLMDEFLEREINRRFTDC